MGWRDSWRRLFGRPAEPDRSTPEPLQAPGSDFPLTTALRNHLPDRSSRECRRWSFPRRKPQPGALPALKRLATRIIEEEGFRLNEAKTRIMRRGRRQSVVGVTVNDVAGLSRQERRRLRAMIHQTDKASASPAVLARIRGKLAFLAMLNPTTGGIDAKEAESLLRVKLSTASSGRTEMEVARWSQTVSNPLANSFARARMPGQGCWQFWR